MQFQELKCLETLFKYLNNKFLLKCICEEVIVDKLVLTSLKRIFRQLIGTLHNLNKVIDKFLGDWQKFNTVKNLLEISEKVENLVNLRNGIYMIIANIAKDDEITNLPELQLVAKDIIDILALCIKPFYANTKIRRILIQLDEKDQEPKRVISYTHKLIIWHLVELLRSLYQMAVANGKRRKSGRLVQIEKIE